MAEIWNEALLDQEVRAMVPRERLWASELGRPPIDLYLKLRGTPLTNPPNPRALRKFEAGNVFEWIVSLVLKRANVLKEGQKWSQFEYTGEAQRMLPVSGKADFIAGGEVNYDKAKEFLDFLERAEVPAVFTRGFNRVLNFLKTKYPNGIEEMPIEVKSVSDYAMDILEKSRVANSMHRRQIFHYLKAMGYKKGLLVYICRDDLRMMEFAILNPSSVELEYKDAIALISKYHYANEMPPKEKLLIWDEDAKKFSKNLGVEWSPYLTKLYGYKEAREYGEPYSKKATNWNRVMARVKAGAKITPKNEEVLKEIRGTGFVVEDLIAKMPDEPVEEENGQEA